MQISPQASDLLVNGHGQRPPSPPGPVNVISALLDLILAPNSGHAFDVRLAACECLQAYLFEHSQIKQFFLRRAIDGYMSAREEADNVLSILIDASDETRGSDPYRRWFAAVLLFHLLYDDFETKPLAKEISEGNAEQGEEVVTCIQSLSAKLVAHEQKGEDERVSVSILMLLCGWLYEDLDAVNDFLGEGSNVQSIVQLISRTDHTRLLVSGLCAFLIGIVYEFSTKDSPITRETLHSILTSRLGREQYVNKITRLREHPMVRDFEVIHQGSMAYAGGFPGVFFDKSFIEFLKDNFSRILRAIDRPPGIEVAVVANGIQKGISRELVDSLKSQVESRNQVVQNLESDVLDLERKLGQEQADHRKAKESAELELARIKSINEALQRNFEDDYHRQLRDHERVLDELRHEHNGVQRSLQTEMQDAKLSNEAAAERVRTRYEAEIADQKANIIRLRTELEKASKEHVQDLQIAHEDYTTKTSSLEARLQRAEERAEESEKRASRLQGAADEKETARNTAQTELDDMLMVLGDLEEKRARDKVGTVPLDREYADVQQARMKELGEQISDDEADSD